MIDHERDLPEFIGLIYDAAVDPSRWKLFLDRLCDLAPGSKSVMMLHDAKTRSLKQSMTARWEEDWTTSYGDYYVKLNKWTEAFAHFDVCRATVVNEIVPREVTLKSEFYGDWLKPQHLIAGVTVSIFKENQRYMNFAVLSEDTDDDVQLRNAGFLQALTPHLRRAGHINRQMSGLNLVSRAIEQAFEQLDRGIVLVHGDGQTFYCNPRAEQYFDQRDGLVMYRDGHVGCQTGDAEDQLQRAIHLAAETARGAGTSAGEIIAVPRRNNPMPWSVMVAPIPPTALDFGHSEGAVALFVADPSQSPPLSQQRLRTVLGLTAAEARVAVGLAEGKSPEQIAEEQGNTILTIRTHLRNAMGRVGVSRLPELVALVLRCAA